MDDKDKSPSHRISDISGTASNRVDLRVEK